MKETSLPIIAFEGVSKHFVKPLDAAERIANLFGVGLREQVVVAVDEVKLSLATARSWDSSANRAAGNRRSAASAPAFSSRPQGA